VVLAFLVYLEFLVGEVPKIKINLEEEDCGVVVGVFG
jgi:hypothetical protein